MRAGMVLASIRYVGDADPASYPAVIIRYLIDNRGTFVVLTEQIIAAVREQFNYYGVEADVDLAGRFQLRSFKGRPAEALTYTIDAEHGLFVVRG